MPVNSVEGVLKPCREVPMTMRALGSGWSSGVDRRTAERKGVVGVEDSLLGAVLTTGSHLAKPNDGDDLKHGYKFVARQSIDIASDDCVQLCDRYFTRIFIDQCGRGDCSQWHNCTQPVLSHGVPVSRHLGARAHKAKHERSDT